MRVVNFCSGKGQILGVQNMDDVMFKILTFNKYKGTPGNAHQNISDRFSIAVF